MNEATKQGISKYCYMCKSLRNGSLTVNADDVRCDMSTNPEIRVPECAKAYQMVRENEVTIKGFQLNIKQHRNRLDACKKKIDKLNSTMGIDPLTCDEYAKLEDIKGTDKPIPIWT